MFCSCILHTGASRTSSAESSRSSCRSSSCGKTIPNYFRGHISCTQPLCFVMRVATHFPHHHHDTHAPSSVSRGKPIQPIPMLSHEWHGLCDHWKRCVKLLLSRILIPDIVERILAHADTRMLQQDPPFLPRSVFKFETCHRLPDLNGNSDSDSEEYRHECRYGPLWFTNHARRLCY